MPDRVGRALFGRVQLEAALVQGRRWCRGLQAPRLDLQIIDELLAAFEPGLRVPAGIGRGLRDRAAKLDLSVGLARHHDHLEAGPPPKPVESGARLRTLG